MLCFFLTGPWVGLQCVIVALPGHTQLRFVHDPLPCYGQQSCSFYESGPLVQDIAKTQAILSVTPSDHVFESKL